MDDTDIDPAIAEAMGFSSFGTKRRKHNNNPQLNDDDDADFGMIASTGANNIALGTRVIGESRSTTTREENGFPEQAEQAEQSTTGEPTDTGLAAMDLQENASAPAVAEKEDVWSQGWPSHEELAALRRGIKNSRGDMVVFLPGFVEDPWKGLL